MEDLLCLGDHLCLYCEDSGGYVFNFQSSAAFNNIYTFQGQDKQKPQKIPNPHAVVFEVLARNRYKLQKTYRSLLEKKKANDKKNVNDINLAAKLDSARVAAAAEEEDNVMEQKRQRGRRLLYGSIIQLRHVFSGKYVHVSTTQTSLRDKNYLMVSLAEHNAKHAQFRILPRYKVKSEGDIIQANDLVILDSVKSPGQFLHVSAPWRMDNFITGCEVNLGVHHTGFAITKFYRPSEDHWMFIKGGAVIRMFHKELEAYLVADGVFQDRVINDVHLHVRPSDQSRPKTMFPSTSAVTYWQIESEHSIIDGDVLTWGQQVRFRHMCTRLYMSVSPNGKVSLTDSGNDPRTVFRLHPVIQDHDEIGYESYTRVEHVLTGLWLHALKDEDYVRESQQEGATRKGLDWDKAPAKKITAIKECMYDDAFTVQKVLPESAQEFNLVAGIVPPVLNLIMDTNAGRINSKHFYHCLTALDELKTFMIVKGVPNKNRQKLVRNLKIVDLLVRYLKTPLPGGEGRVLMEKVFIECYHVLETYLLGDSRKNELYFARYIDYFETQFAIKGDIGLRATQMITELIKDNRRIIDRMEKDNIERIVDLVRVNKNWRYLDLLGVLCVCEGVAIPENQAFITKKWLVDDATGVYLTDLGQKIKKDKDRVYVSKDSGKHWIPLHTFCDRHVSNTSFEEYFFLEHQLDLFGKLCYGRNDYATTVITRALGYLTWEEAFLCLREDLLPHALRAKYCDLIIGMFVDIGNNRSILDQMNLSFVHDDLGRVNSMAKTIDNLPKDTLTIFPVLRDWIADFLDHNKDMTASEIGHNLLVEQVLRLLYFLVSFGYYGDMDDVKKLLPPLLSLLDGRNDKPVKHRKIRTEEGEKLVQRYRAGDRFKEGEETRAVVDAKYRAMEVVDLILNMQFNVRLEKFLSLFKRTDAKPTGMLFSMTRRSFNPYSENSLRRKALKELKTVMESTSLFNTQQLTDILMDLSNYQYDKMITKSMYLLNKFYSAHNDLFEKAVQAQVLITPNSANAHILIVSKLGALKQVAHARSEEQVKAGKQILVEFTGLCHLPNQPDERHPMNQTILINHGIQDVIFSILSQDLDIELMQQYSGLQSMMTAALTLLRFLTKGNTGVQDHVFGQLGFMLNIKGVESDLAMALTEVFTGNQKTCLKISPRDIQRIVLLAVQHQEKAPEFLDLLCAIVKVEELNLPLKRNQGYVMKYIMENYQKVAYVVDKPQEEREEILRNHRGPDHLSYLVSLVDLLATCAEGENRFIESLCQTVFSVDDLIAVLNDPQVDNNLKRPYLRFLLWVYLNTAGNLVESGILDLPIKIVQWMKSLVLDVQSMEKYVRNNIKLVEKILKKEPSKSTVANTPEGRAYGTLHYFFDAAFPFVEVFFKKGFNVDQASELKTVRDELARAFVSFSNMVTPLISNSTHMTTLVNSGVSLLLASDLETALVDQFVARHGNIAAAEAQNILSETQQAYYDYYHDEQLVNARLNTFAINFDMLYRGINTVEAQIGFPAVREYTEIGDDEDLPLGAEFQALVQVFVTPHAKDKYHRANKLVQQLFISATKMKATEWNRAEQVTLDTRCLQVLRALVHNEVVKLPPGWEEDMDGNEDVLKRVKEIQDCLNNHRAVIDTLPLIDRSQDAILRELLAYLAAMLFNASKSSQKALQDNFLGTREELFFTAVKSRMNMSIVGTKEKRFLAAQFEAKQKEASDQAATLAAMSTGGARQHQIQNAIAHEGNKLKREQMEGLIDNGDPKVTSLEMRVLLHDDQLGIDKSKKSQTKDGKNRVQQISEEQRFKEAKKRGEHSDPIQALLEDEGEGHIELILRVMGSMCDGQNKVLQDYLREQPDNIKSVNLIAETTSYLSLLYSNTNSSNIELVIQLFNTLIEFCSGNPNNHHVMYDNHIIDYINYILRANKYEGCTEDQIMRIQDSIGKLIALMVDENRPQTSTLVKEIRDTLDIESVHKVSVDLYKNTMKKGISSDDKEAYITLGFAYHLIVERMADLSSTLDMEKMCKAKDQWQALTFYRKHYLSVEILKDDVLQKVRFRVRDQKVLREEVKEKMKWSVDRSSPSNKIRELMEWSVDIIDDIYYQRNIRSYKVINFMIRFWTVWNLLAIFLSLVINIIMLATWEARGALGKTAVPDGATQLPDSIHDPRPDAPAWFSIVVWVLGACHNVVSLCVLLTYFLSSRPLMPSFTRFKERFRKRAKFAAGVDDTFDMEDPDKMRKKRIADERIEEEQLGKPEEDKVLRMTKLHRGGRENNLRVNLLSFTTLYYILFFVFSLCGTIFYGYFFAFHFLNIVNNNQLLQRVIMAVTMNGRSLLWVAVLGVAIIYIFSLFTFALLRGNMDPGGEQMLYCTTLGECTVTLIRYGLVGELFEFMRPHETELTFQTFGLTVIYHITFYIIITTIGLNIIFGIILDTFSELRSLKWTAESDMRSTCYICSRQSYEFESHAAGYEHHVKWEHNMWAYIFFFIHLDGGTPNDYTDLELYVSRQIKEGKFDFFPIRRALSLTVKDDHQTENKIEDIMRTLNRLVTMQRNEQTEKLRQKEQARQKQWEAKYRQALQEEEGEEE